jgi:orotidine-5'-phosphate decarboxylase
LVGLFKIGSRLFTGEGPEAVRRIAALGVGIFLDLKFHDIPNTVMGAIRAAASLPGIKLINIHAAGGPAMMRAAAEALAPFPNRPQLLGVTVLTSMDKKTMNQVGVPGTTTKQVVKLAQLAKKSGLDGVVTSGHEVKALRRAVGPGFIILVPGIRPRTTSLAKKTDDQERIVTPGEAIRSGADYIVVGRPITGASDPAAAARAVIEEIAEAEAASKR